LPDGLTAPQVLYLLTASLLSLMWWSGCDLQRAQLVVVVRIRARPP